MRLALKKDIVYERIKRDILSGVLSPGEKILRGIELAKQLKVSHITLRTAIKRLEAENLVTQIHGKGTFVTDNTLKSNKTKKFLFLFENTNDIGTIESPTTYILPSCEKNCTKLAIDTNSLCLEFLSSVSKTHALSKLRQCDYDGIVFMSGHFNDNKKYIGEVLQKLGIPVILPHAHATDKHIFPQFATIQPDYKQAWTDGIISLVQQGHSRIASLGSVYKNGLPNLRGFEYTEFLDFLKENGASPDPKLVVGAQYCSDAIAAKVVELMAMTSPPTAIMCFSDFFALDVYKALNKLNIKIPKQVAVMGYCGYPGDEMLSPSLSTVDFEYSNIAQMAIKILNQAEEWFHVDGVAAPHIISPHKIVSRESTAIKRIENKILAKFSE